MGGGGGRGLRERLQNILLIASRKIGNDIISLTIYKLKDLLDRDPNLLVNEFDYDKSNLIENSRMHKQTKSKYNNYITGGVKRP